MKMRIFKKKKYKNIKEREKNYKYRRKREK